MKNPTKLTTTLLNRLALFAGVAAMIGAAYGDTQNEKGDAGELKENAEVFDCKKDKWMGTHGSPTDCDLICLYWGGGPFSIKCVPKAPGLNCGIAVFREDGTCFAEMDAGGAGVTETLSMPDLPKGICYIYTGHWNWYGFKTLTDYTAGPGNEYCKSGGPTGEPGPLYGCKVVGATPGHFWEVCFQEGQNWEHQGVPFKMDATCGPSKGGSKKVGNNKFNGSGSGQVYTKECRGKKAVLWTRCTSEDDNRGATEIRMKGIARSKYTEKYIDKTGGGNLTAEMKKNAFCKNYDPGQKQIFKCVLIAKGAQAKKPKAKETLIMKCFHGGQEVKDTCKIEFYTNYR